LSWKNNWIITKYYAGKYKLVLMHWPRFFSVLERFRGNQEIKWLPIITIPYTFPFLLSLAGGYRQNKNNTVPFRLFFLLLQYSIRELLTDRNLQNGEPLVPYHIHLTEGETQDHQSRTRFHIIHRFFYVKKSSTGEVSQATF